MNKLPEYKRYVFGRGRRILGFCLLILLPPVCMIAVNLLSSLHYMQSLSKPPVAILPRGPLPSRVDSCGSKKIESLASPEFIELTIAEYFWKNRLKMAKKDSIGLVVNLLDSLVSLDIKGVPVRECKIQKYEISSVLRYAKEKGALTNWFAENFVLQDYWATLPKAPIKVKEAPADTNEAKEMVDANPPLEKQDVRFILQFNKNLILQFDQTEPFVFTGWFEKHFRNLQFRLEKGIEFIYTLLKLKWPEPELSIKVKLSQADAKAIFRALPQKAETIVRF
jgi:hypothetical protein